MWWCSNHHWFRRWLVACSAPSHYLNKCWNVVNWTLKDKLHWNFNLNPLILIQENVFENVVLKTAAILPRPLPGFKIALSQHCHHLTLTVLQSAHQRFSFKWTVTEKFTPIAYLWWLQWRRCEWDVSNSQAFWQILSFCWAYMLLAVPLLMVTSSNGSSLRVTGLLCVEFTGHRWIPHTKTSDAELWCFLWSASE